MNHPRPRDHCLRGVLAWEDRLLHLNLPVLIKDFYFEKR